jgi:hypothetical protein
MLQGKTIKGKTIKGTKVEKNSESLYPQRIDEPNGKSPALRDWVHLSVGKTVFSKAPRTASVFSLFEKPV